MASDWLFGPRMTEVHPGRLDMRSLLVDLDTVRDVLSLARERLGDAGLYTVDKVAAVDGMPVAFDEERLDTAADWEIRRLMVRAGENHQQFAVDLRRGEQPTIHYANPEAGAIAREIAEMLLADGRPRPHWQPVVPSFPILAVGLAAICWVWFLVGQDPPVSLGIAGSIVVALSAVSAWNAYERLRNRIYMTPFPGHRIRVMSRQEVRTRRADRHANLRLAAVTIPVGAVLGAFASWFFDLPWSR